MTERRYVEDVVDDEGWIVEAGYTAWECRCGQEVRRYRGQGDVLCECGQWFNASGQRLRSDWMSNRSNYDEDISDLDGYEMEGLSNNDG